MATEQDGAGTQDLAGSNRDLPGTGRRPAAGEDPQKREQILDGAQCVFMQMGFDAASMNDITKAAGVSKGTLYVYFENKEDLFAAIVERKRGRALARLREVVDAGGTVHDVLYRYGLLMTETLTAEGAIRGSRVVVGVVERMPELAKRYFANRMSAGPKLLADYMKSQLEAGHLRDIDDFDLAARQFAELCMAGLFRPLLFGEMQETPSRERIERNVRSALKMFLNSHGVS